MNVILCVYSIFVVVDKPIYHCVCVGNCSSLVLDMVYGVKLTDLCLT